MKLDVFSLNLIFLRYNFIISNKIFYYKLLHLPDFYYIFLKILIFNIKAFKTK